MEYWRWGRVGDTSDVTVGMFMGSRVVQVRLERLPLPPTRLSAKATGHRSPRIEAKHRLAGSIACNDIVLRYSGTLSLASAREMDRKKNEKRNESCETPLLIFLVMGKERG